jgi:hypothetical protein
MFAEVRVKHCLLHHLPTRRSQTEATRVRRKQIESKNTERKANQSDTKANQSETVMQTRVKRKQTKSFCEMCESEP